MPLSSLSTGVMQIMLVMLWTASPFAALRSLLRLHVVSAATRVQGPAAARDLMVVTLEEATVILAHIPVLILVLVLVLVPVREYVVSAAKSMVTLPVIARRSSGVTTAMKKVILPVSVLMLMVLPQLFAHPGLALIHGVVHGLDLALLTLLALSAVLVLAAALVLLLLRLLLQLSLLLLQNQFPSLLLLLLLLLSLLLKLRLYLPLLLHLTQTYPLPRALK